MLKLLHMLMIAAAIQAGIPFAQAQPKPPGSQAAAVQQSLFEAIERNDARALPELIKRGVHLSARNEDGEAAVVPGDAAASNGKNSIL